MISFFGMPGRSSGKIRGSEMARALGGNFYDKNSFKLQHGPKGFFKTCVFIRDYDENTGKRFKQNSQKVVYDLLDRPVADLHVSQRGNSQLTEIDWKRYIHESIDEYLVNNSMCKKQLSSFLLPHQKITVMPHHIISNVVVRRDNIANPPKVVGYLGVQNQIHEMEKIKNFCNSIGLDFISSNLNTKEECINFLEKLDIGIVFLNRNERTDYVFKYKPSVKLLNFQAMGIPAVCCSYESFKEHAPENSFILSDEIDKTLESISLIKENLGVRTSLYENGLKNAKNYTMEEIAKIYKNICEAL